MPPATLLRRSRIATALAIGLACLAGLAKVAAEAWYYPEYCGRVAWKCTAGTVAILSFIGATALAGLLAVTAIGLWIAYLRARITDGDMKGR